MTQPEDKARDGSADRTGEERPLLRLGLLRRLRCHQRLNPRGIEFLETLKLRPGTVDFQRVSGFHVHEVETNSGSEMFRG